MSEEAKKHYNNCRFRCRKCSETFCSECKTFPYHFGFSCAELKAKNEKVLCRFCEEPLSKVTMGEHLDVLAQNGQRIDHCDQCDSELVWKVSTFKFPCKHANYYSEDFFSEEKCECLHPDCRENMHDTNLEDFCGLCGIEPLKRYPVIKLACSHVFHTDCLEQRLTDKWQTNNISMSYTKCPLCNKQVEVLNGYLDPLYVAEAIRTDLALRIAAQLDALKIDIGKKPEDDDYVDEGLRKLNYYECDSCKSLYFGGVHECGEQIEVPKSELKCSGCRGCKSHGEEHLLFKCRYCCSLATWFCFGHTHFCTPCHDRFTNWVETGQYQYMTDKVPQCPGPDQCPLGCAHPPNGEEHCLGCSACKDVFDKDKQHLFPDPPRVQVAAPAPAPAPAQPPHAYRPPPKDNVRLDAHRFLPAEAPAERPVFVARRPAAGGNVGKLLAMFQQQ